jgi:hypothetical protein
MSSVSSEGNHGRRPLAKKALITRRDARAPISAHEVAAAIGLFVEASTPNGTLVSGSDEQYRAMEARGFRVKVLTDSNILRIGQYTIDTATGSEPDVPSALDVPAQKAAHWPHHLVQLVGPPTDEWVRGLEAQGVEVVEPISGYGLFVHAYGDTVRALRRLPFVAWTGPLKPAYRIQASSDMQLEYLSIGVYPAAQAASVRTAVDAAGGQTLEQGTQRATYGGEFATLRARGADLEKVAMIPHVRWVEAVPRMEPLGEREAQIVAKNLNWVAPPNTSPVIGYGTWLTSVGVNGNGVTVAIADSGVDSNASNNDQIAHSDLRGRQKAFVDYSGGLSATDTNGHGTNVAGIAVGNAATGQTEAAAPGNFLWGQGVAPGASFVTLNFTDSNVNPRPDIQTIIRDSAVNLAQIMNNSWGNDDRNGSGYPSEARKIDLGVRDANPNSAVLEPLAIVCAAGNAGGRPQSITYPHETKNTIVVGNSLTSRPGVGFPSDDIRGIHGTSARGPARDGRLLPTIVAPGTSVSSAFSRTATKVEPISGTGVPNPANPVELIDQYTFLTGTSQASPQVAGACAVLTEWWRNLNGSKNPSPAMLKALVVNGAEDLVGGENWRCLNRALSDKKQWQLHSMNVYQRPLAFVPTAIADGNQMLEQVQNVASLTAAGQWAYDPVTSTIFVRMLADTDPGAAPTQINARDTTEVEHVPNNDQGWGRLNLSNVLLQNPASTIWYDQNNVLNPGQEFLINVAPMDAARPLRVTLTWTDAAGAVYSLPALVNDLDLEVTELATGTVFKGNVFDAGFSTAGGSFDSLNTIECVFIKNPKGTYEIRVIGAVIAASASPSIATPWQDFALVIDNSYVPAASPATI